jgi:hypothetical protein
MCSPTLLDTRSAFLWDDPRITLPRPAGEAEHLQGLLRRRQRISKSMSADRRLLGAAGVPSTVKDLYRKPSGARRKATPL